MRVLIADDDREMAEVLAEQARECGHEVVACVTNGGLAVIRSFARHKPDVVLLDFMMPHFNGLTVCHALRSRNAAAKIIIVSGHADGKHPFVSHCGAMACLQKPVSLGELREALAAVSGNEVRA